MAKKKTASQPSEEPARAKFRLEAEPLPRRRLMLESFARALYRFLVSSEKQPGSSKQAVLAAVEDASGQNLDPRQFDAFLKHLFADGYLRLGYHRDSDRAEQLRGMTNFKELKGITVVAGSDPARFARAAAEDFIQRMLQIGEMKKAAGGGPDEQVLNVGIVSGSTTGMVISALMDAEDWSKQLDVRAGELPRVRVFALNVCLTVPEHLPGNATILAYQLAKKINVEAGRPDLARAYGLSATLLVKEGEELEEQDEAPQTFDVLRFTQPYRVQKKLKERGELKGKPEPTDTELDIVLTGVGELPRERQGGGPAKGRGVSPGSIFYNLAEQFGFRMDEMIAAEHIVGDLAFTAIRADGEAVPLSGKYRTITKGLGPVSTQGQGQDDDEKTKYVFYSAVQLPVLAAMAVDHQHKSVILVARHSEGKYKVPAIFASIAGERTRYASRLVIDEETARGLAHY